MGFVRCARKVGGCWVCWEWKRVRRGRGKFGVRGGESDDGDGLCFWTFIISQLARENRGSDHLSTVTDAGKFYSGKAN